MIAPVFDPVDIALAEDVGPGDLTSQLFIPEQHVSMARIFAKENCVVAGTQAAIETYQKVDPSLEVTRMKGDGTPLKPGDTVIRLQGPTRSILTGERVALNFIQRLSGVATLTAQYVAAVRGTGVEILDTRKTTPGLRALEKAAVKAGGGRNHRMGLYDAVMVKDNHLLVGPKIEAAIVALREAHPGIQVELEADSIDQVRAFIDIAGVDIILLDNMSPKDLRACVLLRKSGIKFEASGGVSLQTVREIAETGVDFISVGQLTHSARAIDFSLELIGA
ncbi:MAG TPA: carboxylating nicotinate-nucleotide diphosphorylase [Chthoniobacterales bacterium]